MQTVIMGDGTTGTGVAMHLQRSSHSAALVEPRPEPCAELAGRHPDDSRPGHAEGFLARDQEKVRRPRLVTACIGNVGPGLAGVGATQNYGWIPLPGKWVLILCMLLGRLEIFTVLVVLRPSFWRR